MVITKFPKNIGAPKLFKTKKVTIKPLNAKHAKMDYRAVMSSFDHLRKNPNPPMCKNWPSLELTLEKNICDLNMHDKMHRAREAFTYTILNTGETKCLGCIYIFPSKNDGAKIYFWVTKKEFDKELDVYVYNLLNIWLKEKFGSKKVVFPRRREDGTIIN